MKIINIQYVFGLFLCLQLTIMSFEQQRRSQLENTYKRLERGIIIMNKSKTKEPHISQCITRSIQKMKSIITELGYKPGPSWPV